MEITRRGFFKMAGVAALGAAVGQFGISEVAAEKFSTAEKSTVYFTKKNRRRTFD